MAAAVREERDPALVRRADLRVDQPPATSLVSTRGALTARATSRAVRGMTAAFVAGSQSADHRSVAPRNSADPGMYMEGSGEMFRGSDRAMAHMARAAAAVGIVGDVSSFIVDRNCPYRYLDTGHPVKATYGMHDSSSSPEAAAPTRDPKVAGVADRGKCSGLQRHRRCRLCGSKRGVRARLFHIPRVRAPPPVVAHVV